MQPLCIIKHRLLNLSLLRALVAEFHELIRIRHVSRSEANPGRVYYKCPNHGVSFNFALISISISETYFEMLNFCHRENRMVATITTGKILEMMGEILILIFLSRMGIVV